MSDDLLGLKKSGYSAEEAYFYEVNKKLTEDLRRGLRKHSGAKQSSKGRSRRSPKKK